MDGSQCLWLEQPTQSRLEDRLKSWKAPRLGLDPQAILRSGGQEDAIHTESWLKHAEHLKSSLPTSNPLGAMVWPESTGGTEPNRGRG